MSSYPVQIARVSGESVSYRLMGKGARRVLFFHGFPGSSIQISLFDSRLEADDLTVLCLDRPGYGSSAPSTHSQLTQGIRHCLGVLEELGWDRFEIFAVSGGTPLGLSLAHELGARITRTTVACGLGPLGDPRAGRLMPRKARLALALLPRLPSAFLARALRNPARESSQANSTAFRRDLAVLRYLFDASTPDQEVLAGEGVQLALALAKVEAFAQGGLGPQADAHCYLTPWGWELSHFKGAVRFFHGKEDRVIPPAMAELMAGLIPGSELHLIEGEGHFSLPIRKLAWLLEDR